MGFVYCFNSVPKLYTQADKTPQWETNIGIDFTSKLCWWQNHSHWHHRNTHNLRSAATHSSIEYKTLQPFLLFCSTKRKLLKTTQKETLNLKSLHFSSVFYGTVWRKNRTIILQITHRKTQLCPVSSGILLSGSHWHHKHTFPLAQHQGKYPPARWIHPWIDPTSVSPQACSTAFRGGIRGLWLAVLCVPSLARRGKKSSVGFRNGEFGVKYKTLNWLWLVIVCLFWRPWNKPVLKQWTKTVRFGYTLFKVS